MIDKIVDCVVLNYNDSETTINMVKSISEYNSISHIIIVDNCSTDNSFSILKNIVSEKVILIKTDFNGGYGYGNNAGVFYSQYTFQSDYVIIANPDVSFDENCVFEMAKIMANENQCSIVAPLQLNSNGEVIPDYAWPIPTVWRTIFSAGHFLQRYLWKNYGFEWLKAMRTKGTISCKVDCVPGAMIMVRTTDFCKVLGYDDNNFLYWEESMIGMKVIRNGGYSKLLLNSTYMHYHAVTINKSIPQKMGRIKLLLKSRLFFVENYLEANTIQLFIARLFFLVCFIEESIITRLKPS